MLSSRKYGSTGQIEEVNLRSTGKKSRSTSPVILQRQTSLNQSHLQKLNQLEKRNKARREKNHVAIDRLNQNRKKQGNDQAFLPIKIPLDRVTTSTESDCEVGIEHEEVKMRPSVQLTSHLSQSKFKYP